MSAAAPTTPSADPRRVHDGAASPPDDVTRLATLGTLACMLAHEMNNLLTPVLSYARLAMDAPADVALGRKAHEHAIRGVEACNAMAESILGFARQEGGDVAGVGVCVEAALRCVPRELAKDGIRLELGVDDALEASISPTSLTQVLLNLILNAREAMGGGGRLTIRAERSTWNTGEDRVRIMVEDTGAGIEPDELERVFLPFVSRGDRSSGVGLGLAICSRLLDDAGGRISVSSEVGQGTAFVVDLPAA